VHKLVTTENAFTDARLNYEKISSFFCISVVHRRREFGIPGWFPIAHLFMHLSLPSVSYIFTHNGIWESRHKVLRKGLEASWHTSGLYLAARV